MDFEKTERAFLCALELNTNYRFVEILPDGTIQRLISGLAIPPDQIPGNTQGPGLYRIIEHTCNGSCAIGRPKALCIDDGTYAVTKCAVYSLLPADSGILIPPNALQVVLRTFINALAILP